MMFQISKGKSLFDAVWSPEYFDTFLIEMGQKMRQCGSKINFEQGGGSENDNFVNYWNNIPHFTFDRITIDVFEVKESIFMGFVKIWFFVFVKSAILRKIVPWGRFARYALTLRILKYFSI